MKKKFTVGGLFSGVGGFEIGFMQAGFKVLWANEIDKSCAVTYKANYDHTLYEKSINDNTYILEYKEELLKWRRERSRLRKVLSVANSMIPKYE